MRALKMFRSVCVMLTACALTTAAWAQPNPPPQALPKNFGQKTSTTQSGKPIPILQQPAQILPTEALSATVTSPLSVALSWPAVAGATGYTLVRDGVPLVQLGVATLSYTDNTVKPFTSHGYQVQVNGVPANPRSVVATALSAPLSSAIVRVDIPPPNPPAAFTAGYFGTSIRLTWTPRPEASAYKVSKGSQTFRVEQSGAPTMTDPVVGSADVSYSIQTIVRAFDGTETAGYPSAALTIRVRPFNVAVVGDSVMWGQGLSTPSKFSSIVIQSLGIQLGGRKVRMFNFAHSGADLGDGDADDRNRPANATMVGGEVPETYPTILNQIMNLVRNQVEPSDVDFILMDGCANDVSIGSLLQPTTTDDSITALTKNYCGQQMEHDLELIRSVYRNAKIIVTGYFPIVSNSSNLAAIYALLITLGGPVGLGGSIDFQQKAIDHSTVFFTTSTTNLQIAVQTANSRSDANATVNPNTNTNAIKLVIPPFTADNAYTAPNSWLWPIPSPPTLPNYWDQVFWQRQATCHSMGASMPFMCPPASTGHPNPQGALSYANSIIVSMADFIPAWQTQFALVKRLP